MAWSFFRTRAGAPDAHLALWWRDANAAALRPVPAALDDLRPRLASPEQIDERERQEEMLAALERVCAFATSGALPVLETQHRVIGTDVCHFMAPVSAPDHGDASGKLFLTSQRIIFAGGASIAWPWHRVRRAARHDRDVVFEGGDSLTLRLRCNSYGDAAVAAAVAERLSRR
ncbi:MAG: hypothetical protein WCQ64_10405 [Acidobacteriota bacterium]